MILVEDMHGIYNNYHVAVIHVSRSLYSEIGIRKQTDCINRPGDLTREYCNRLTLTPVQNNTMANNPRVFHTPMNTRTVAKIQLPVFVSRKDCQVE